MSVLDELRRTGGDLPGDLRKRVLALGPESVPELIAILEDEELSDPPIHAVDLLADLKVPEAIEPMLDVLEATDFDHVIHDRLIQRLPDFGELVLEPGLARLESIDDRETFRTLVGILAELGVKDERVFARIREVWKESPDFAAHYFAAYGDPRALPILRQGILDFVPDFTSRFWRLPLSEILQAYGELGGSVDRDVSEYVQAIDAAAKEIHPAPARSAKIGRNEPCPCGSGKKFKKCCLAKSP